MSCYVRSDFSVVNVFENSHSAKPLMYKLSGVWGNHEGSMLLWVLILSVFGALVAVFGANLPVVLPMTLPLQRIGDVLRHIGLVMFGEHAIGAEGPAWIESTFGNHALPFAEKIRQKAAVCHRHGTFAVGHLETNSEPVAAQNAALLHQAADAQARPGFDLLFHHLGRRIEEDDGVFERAKHQRHRERENAQRSADKGEASLLASHRAAPKFLSPRLPAFHAGVTCEMKLGPFAGGRRAMRTALICRSLWTCLAYQFRPWRVPIRLVKERVIGNWRKSIRMSIRFSRNPAKQTKSHQAMWRGRASTGIPSTP